MKRDLVEGFVVKEVKQALLGADVEAMIRKAIRGLVDNTDGNSQNTLAMQWRMV
jgi:hypothetical protein